MMNEELGDKTVREHDGGVHVVVTHWPEDGNPNNVLVRLEIWPVSAVLGAKIVKELAELAMKRLNEAGESDGEWEVSKEGLPADESVVDAIVAGPRTLQ
jgi:hypothetical protein